MSFIKIVILAIIQGAAELLPVSSSAHVIIAQKLMGFDPTTPEMTFLLVMLHTGTMFATIVYFWHRWRALWKGPDRKVWIQNVLIATVATLVAGVALKVFLEKVIFRGSHFELEHLFGNLSLVAVCLFSVGLLIIFSGFKSEKSDLNRPIDQKVALWIGLVQGLAVPFRGFSRSGATISAGLLLKCPRMLVEEFSFLLAVVLTPAVIVRAFWRIHHHRSDLPDFSWISSITPGLIGMVATFIAGLVALKFLTAVLEKGRWAYFGFYCLFAAAACVFVDRVLIVG